MLYCLRGCKHASSVHNQSSLARRASAYLSLLALCRSQCHSRTMAPLGEKVTSQVGRGSSQDLLCFWRTAGRMTFGNIGMGKFARRRCKPAQYLHASVLGHSRGCTRVPDDYRSMTTSYHSWSLSASPRLHQKQKQTSPNIASTRSACSTGDRGMYHETSQQDHPPNQSSS